MAKRGRPKPKIPMYTPTERMRYVECGCDRQNRRKPPGWLLDKIAEEKLTGNFNVNKSNICPTCYIARSANGTCSGCGEAVPYTPEKRTFRKPRHYIRISDQEPKETKETRKIDLDELARRFED